MSNKKKEQTVFLIVILLLPMFTVSGVNQARASASLRVALLPTQGTATPGSPFNVQITYTNEGDVDLNLKLFVYDNGNFGSSPRPILRYGGTPYTTITDDYVIFGTMSLPVGHENTITVALEVYSEMTNGRYGLGLGGWHQRDGDAFYGFDEKPFNLYADGCAPENLPPTAVISSPFDGSVYNVGDSIVFDGSASSDTDGTITTYNWSSSIDGTLSSQALFSSTSLSAGNHVVTLTVTDDDGASDSEQVSIRVNEPPRAMANLVGVIGQFEIGATISFDGSRSTDDSAIVSYSWSSSIDGFLSNQPFFSTNTLSLGRHTVTLKVTDDDGASNSDYEIVKIVPYNEPPVANAGPDQVACIDETGEVIVTLDGRGSHDDKRIVSYSWRGSGGLLDPIPGRTGPIVSYTFTASGTYRITLRVTDEEGESDSDEIVVTVERRVKPIAIFTASPGGYYYDIGEKITFDGSPSYDRDGIIISYSWSSSRDGHLSSNSRFSISDLSKGWHQVTLEVTDNQGNKGYAQKSLVVGQNDKSKVDLIVQSVRADVTVNYSYDNVAFSITLIAEICNSGSIDAEGVEVVFYRYVSGNRIWLGKDVISVRASGKTEAIFHWETGEEEHIIIVEADPANSIEEENEENNMEVGRFNINESMSYSLPVDLNDNGIVDMYLPITNPNSLYEVYLDPTSFNRLDYPYQLWSANELMRFSTEPTNEFGHYRVNVDFLEVYDYGTVPKGRFTSYTLAYYFETTIIDSFTGEPVAYKNVWKKCNSNEADENFWGHVIRIFIAAGLHVLFPPAGEFVTALHVAEVLHEGITFSNQYYFIGKTDADGKINILFNTSFDETYFVDYDEEVPLGIPTEGIDCPQLPWLKRFTVILVKKNFYFKIKKEEVVGHFGASIVKYIDTSSNSGRSTPLDSSIWKDRDPETTVVISRGITEFTHNFQDRGNDEDSDGLYDFLAIDVEIRVGVDGSYFISSYLIGPNGDPITSATSHQNLESGTQIVTLNFRGKEINYSAIDGPYCLSNLALFDSSGTLLDFEDQIYLTTSYLHSDFQDRYIEFTDNYSDYCIDIDGNGTWDTLVTELGLDVNKAGYYTVQGELYDSNGSFIDSSKTNTFLDTGLQIASLKFNGMKINQNGFTGVLILKNVIILDNQNRFLNGRDFACETASTYGFEHFEAPTVRLNEVMKDYGKDVNNNGLYEYLTAEIAVSVEKEDDYLVAGFLYSMSGIFISMASTMTYLRDGIQIVVLDFDGEDIYESRENGPYLIGYLEVCDLNNNPISKISLKYQTVNRQYSDFEGAIPATMKSEKKNVDFNWIFKAFAHNTISEAESLYEEINELLDEAEKEKLDISACESLIEEALSLLEKARSYYAGGSYIAANNFALEAIKKFKEAIECLEEYLK